MTRELNVDFVEAAARLCHEITRTYNLGHWDASLDPWDLTDETMRASVRSGVRFALEHPSMTPAGMHEEWRRYKAAQGWVYGPAKDPVKKTHPNMLPYTELSEQEKLKDEFFLTIVRNLLRVWPSSIFFESLDFHISPV